MDGYCPIFISFRATILRIPPRPYRLTDRLGPDSSSPPTESGGLKSYLIFDSSKLAISQDSIVTELGRFRLASNVYGHVRFPGVAPPGIAANIGFELDPSTMYPKSTGCFASDDRASLVYASNCSCIFQFHQHRCMFHTSLAFLRRIRSPCIHHVLRPIHSLLCLSQIQTSGIDFFVRYHCCQ